MPVTVQDLNRVLEILNDQLREILFNRMILRNLVYRLAKQSNAPEAWLANFREELVAELEAGEAPVPVAERSTEAWQRTLEEFISDVEIRINLPN